MTETIVQIVVVATVWPNNVHSFWLTRLFGHWILIDAYNEKRKKERERQREQISKTNKNSTQNKRDQLLVVAFPLHHLTFYLSFFIFIY